jgi:hypothetical protein
MRERFEREREKKNLEMICKKKFVAIILEGEEEKESKPRWVATTLEKCISIMQSQMSSIFNTQVCSSPTL